MTNAGQAASQPGPQSAGRLVSYTVRGDCMEAGGSVTQQRLTRGRGCKRIDYQ
jgi:hypothetical protein